MDPKQARKLLSGKEPPGVLAQGFDGNVYFLTNNDARKARVPVDTLVNAYLMMRKGGVGSSPPIREPKGICKKIKRWLFAQPTFGQVEEVVLGVL